MTVRESESVCERRGGKMRAQEVSLGVYWLQAILIKMIGNDHRGRALLAWTSFPQQKASRAFSSQLSNSATLTC